MMRGQRALRDSQGPSPEGSEDDEARSPISNDGDDSILELKTPPTGRGRKGKHHIDREGQSSSSSKKQRDAMDVMH